MFGIGLGEIILILFVFFLIAPKDIPKLMRKIGQFFGAVDRLRKEFTAMGKEIQDATGEAGKEIREAAGEIKEAGAVRKKISGTRKKKRP